MKPSEAWGNMEMGAWGNMEMGTRKTQEGNMESDTRKR